MIQPYQGGKSHLRGPEVAELAVEVLVEQDVRGLDVAMDDLRGALLVQVLNGLRELEGYRQPVSPGKNRIRLHSLTVSGAVELFLKVTIRNVLEHQCPLSWNTGRAVKPELDGSKKDKMFGEK